MDSDVKEITKKTVIYAWPNGTCYHLDRQCRLLSNGIFRKYGYKIIKEQEIKSRHLTPCRCACEKG